MRKKAHQNLLERIRKAAQSSRSRRRSEKRLRRTIAGHVYDPLKHSTPKSKVLFSMYNFSEALLSLAGRAMEAKENLRYRRGPRCIYLNKVFLGGKHVDDTPCGGRMRKSSRGYECMTCGREREKA